MTRFMIGVFLACTALAGCTVQRTAANVQQLQTVASATQYDQIKMQLSRSIDDPYAVPSLTTFGAGVLKTNAQANMQFTKTLSETGTAESISKTSTQSFGLPSLNSSAETLLNTSTVSSPVGIRVMRDMFANAVTGAPLDQEIEAKLLNKPPKYPWLFHSSGGTPAECAQLNCQYLGKYGRYKLWAKDERSYSDFVLALLEGAAMKGAEVVLSAEPAQKRTKTKRPIKKTSAASTNRTNDLNLQPQILVVPSE